MAVDENSFPIVGRALLLTKKFLLDGFEGILSRSGAMFSRAVVGVGSPVVGRFFSPSLGHSWVRVVVPKSSVTIFVMAQKLDGAFLAVSTDLENDAVADFIFPGTALNKAQVTTSANRDSVQSIDPGWQPIPCDGQIHEIPLTDKMKYGNVYFQHSSSDGAGGGVGSDGFVWVGAQS